MSKQISLFILLVLSMATNYAVTPEFDASTASLIRIFLTACSEGDVETIKATFEKNASQVHTLTGAKDAQGRTGLMFLVQCASKKGIEFVLPYCKNGEEHIRHEYRPGEYYTARTYALAEWNPEIAALLPEDNEEA